MASSSSPKGFDVVVLGGGAAGLMCAIVAGQRGRRVVVVEHAERVGKKILMSGGGRCNFTNKQVTPDNYLSANPHFCKSALARYQPSDFIALVRKHGIAFHEKELGQLFCDHFSKQIVDLLLAECQAARVDVRVGCTVGAIEKIPDGFVVQTARGPLRAASLVIATGGLSIPTMGATGFGYDVARQFGLRLRPTRAALVPFTVSEADREELTPLSGISLPVVTQFGKRRFRAGLLFTHRGLSGPSILQISSYWQPGQPIAIDWLDGEDGAAWLLARKRERPGIELKNALGERLPKRLAPYLLPRLAPQAGEGFDSRPLRGLGDALLRDLGERLNRYAFDPAGTEGYRKAEVTLGGVDTDELSSATLEAKQVAGLYFIGEVVDVTGHLGGFNFQWAWASGHAAGQAA
jgi:predicted Rossmann fold flavoprotein